MELVCRSLSQLSILLAVFGKPSSILKEIADRGKRMDLHQIIYTSVCAEGVSYLDFLDLVKTADRNNKQRDVTGILAHGGGKFLSGLEGPTEAINQTFSKICKDRRHSEVQILSYDAVAERAFPDWGLFLINLDQPHHKRRGWPKGKYAPGEELFFPDDPRLAFALLWDLRSAWKPKELPKAA